MRIQATLPPTAAPVPAQSLAAGMAALFGGTGRIDDVIRQFRERFESEHVFLVSSGKAALALILQALHRLSGRRKVVIPAYTCYSVPSAVLKAGLEVVPCDVDPTTLDFRPDRFAQVLDEQALCVLSTHLFGLPADLDCARALCDAQGAFLVEDAAQAMGGTFKGRRLGTVGDVAFFSLGRGKNLSCGGGGVILTASKDIGAAIGAAYDGLESESVAAAVRNLAELTATSICIHPSLYWLPAGLPFLGLGETRFYTDFPIRKMGEARAATLMNWPDRLRAANRSRIEQAEALIQELRRTAPGVVVKSAPGAVYLRLPVLVQENAAKQAVLAEAAAMGLGISQGYPGTMWEIPELQGRLPERDDEGAREVVERLVTLPTHGFVSPEHRRKICRLIGQISAAAGRRRAGDPTAGQGSSSSRAASSL